MIDENLKNIILLRHGSYDKDSGCLSASGFIQAMLVAEFLKTNKYPIPDTTISSDEERAVQMSDIVSMTLTDNKIPSFQHGYVYRHAINGVEMVFIKNKLEESSNIVLCVSHQPAISGSLNINESTIKPGDTFLVSGKTWQDVFRGNGSNKKIISLKETMQNNQNLLVENLISACNFSEFNTDKIPAILECLKNNQPFNSCLRNALNHIRIHN